MIIPLVVAVGVGVAVGRATKPCPACGPDTPLTRNAARTLLQARDAVDRLEPVLVPLSRGNTPSPRAILDVIRG